MKKVHFIDNVEISLFSKNKLAYAYFGRRIFLSLLAGKFATFEQMLLTDQAFFLNGVCVLQAPVFFLKGFSVGKYEPTKFTNKQHFSLWFRRLNLSSDWKYSSKKCAISVLYLCIYLSSLRSHSFLLIRAESIRNIHQSVCKKKEERNHKLTNALEYKLCFLKQ